MITMLTYNAGEEGKQLYEETRNQVAYLTEDKWNIVLLQTLQEVDAYLNKNKLLDVICFDVKQEDAIERIERIREENKKAYIILIASPKMSPIKYIKPSIMAASLIFHPVKLEEYRKVMQSVVKQFQNEKADDGELMIIETSDGKQRIPLQNVMYFEAKIKKVYACLEAEEYGYYDSLEHLMIDLPEYFKRCHRGYIVNTKMIQRVALSEGVIYLHQGVQVPLSRSYKAELKEYK